MKHHDDLKERIRDAIDIRQYLESRGVPKKGGRFVPPWRPDSDSGGFSCEARFYKDHARDDGGDIFRLIEVMEGVDFPQALRIAAAYVGMHVPPTETSDGGGRILTLGEAGRIWEDMMTAKPEKKGVVVAHYNYHDDAGTLLFQKLRYEPKDFRLRRPDPEKDAWLWNMQGARWVLYRWPEWKDKAGVVVAGGEKDADNLWKMGIPATTNGEGEGKWLPEYTEALTGKRVIIIPDNDYKGRLHAAVVAESVLGKAASVKVLDLAVPHKGGDASDWIEAGGTRDGFADLCEFADELSAADVEKMRCAVDMEKLAMDEDRKPGTSPVKNAGLWLVHTSPVVKQLFPGLLDAEAKLLLNGSSKCRKSFLVMQMALSAATGKRFLRWDCQPMRVLMLQAEVPEAHMHRRLWAGCRSLGIDPANLGENLRVANTRGSAFTMDAPPLWLVEEAKNTDLLIIDPVYKFFDGEENSGRDAATFLAGIDTLCKASGAAAVYVHHAAKGTPGDRQTIDRGSGSGVFSRDFDASLFLGVQRDTPDTLVVEPIVRAYPPIDAFCIQFDNGAFKLSNAVPTVKTSSDRGRPSPSSFVPEITRILQRCGPMLKTDLITKAQASGISRTAARDAVEIALVDGIFRDTIGPHNSKKIQFAAPQTESRETW